MRLIDADAYQYPGDLINEPTIDAEPVRHGRWTEDGLCVDCGFEAMFFMNSHIQVRTHFCPNCGAKMDAEVHDGSLSQD